MSRIAVIGVFFFLASNAWADAKVTLLRTPDHGIQPQAAVDEKGTLHLIYFKGDAFGGDLFYVRRLASKHDFSHPVRVNSQPGSAVAAGTVRGGQLAVGKDSRVHVVWNGSGKVKAKDGSPVFYSRLDDDGKGFEPQRDLRNHTGILDGGCTVTADAAGNILVAWHAVETGDKGEEQRQVWVARSTDDGKTFSKESPAWSEPTGACGCCSMRAFSDGKKAVHMLYRSATADVNRDIFLLSSGDGGKSFKGINLHKWKINTCPMSTLAFAQGSQGVMTAWDTQGQIFFTMVKPGTTEVGKIQSPTAHGKQARHPALAINDAGEMVLAWTEGTEWMRGGSLLWQAFDKDGRPTAEHGRREGAIPVWGLPTVVATKDGFLIIH